MKLSEWARREGVHYQTACKWWKAGKLSVPARKLPSGVVVVDVPATASEGKAVAYCRVSSADQKADLERQAGRVVAAATARGLAMRRDRLARFGVDHLASAENRAREAIEAAAALDES